MTRYRRLHPKGAPLRSLATDPDRLHQQLFFGLCRDIKDLTIHQNSVPTKELLDLVADYATAEDNALDKKGRKVMRL
jgi:hypothetical protein